MIIPKRTIDVDDFKKELENILSKDDKNQIIKVGESFIVEEGDLNFVIHCRKKKTIKKMKLNNLAKFMLLFISFPLFILACIFDE